MSEAFGTVVIRAPQAILQNMCDAEEGEIPLSSMEALFSHAGIADLRVSHNMLQWVSEQLPEEGKTVKNGFICITIFGEEWMFLMEALVTQGKNVEVYGLIDHEHGARGYYALNHVGDSVFEMIDYESEINIDNESAIQEEWKSRVSTDALATFPDAFE